MKTLTCPLCGHELLDDTDADLLSCVSCRTWLRYHAGGRLEAVEVARVATSGLDLPWRQPARRGVYELFAEGA